MKLQFFSLFTLVLFAGCAGMQAKDGAEFACEDCLLIKEDREAKVGEETRTLASGSVEDVAASREPAAMVGNFAWLNSIQDDFDRIASETSQRSIANTEPSVLVARKRWSFRYHPDQNAFHLKLDGNDFAMMQTKFEDTGLFAFAATGQTEDPITLSVTRREGDLAAGNPAGRCVFELSFWDKRERSYGRDIANIRGNRCQEIMNQLRSYVP